MRDDMKGGSALLVSWDSLSLRDKQIPKTNPSRIAFRTEDKGKAVQMTDEFISASEQAGWKWEKSIDDGIKVVPADFDHCRTAYYKAAGAEPQRPGELLVLRTEGDEASISGRAQMGRGHVWTT